MNCPRCGSGNVQFGTNTSGGGFSAGKGCCGYIALGPLGLLCGACGSKTKTDEFWVCQKCGNKFTAKEAQLVQQRIQNSKIKKTVEQIPFEDPNEKSYTVVLNYTVNSKLQCIKEIREITGYGLAEANKMVENLPATIKVCDTREEAEYIVNRFVSLGAVAEISEDNENIEENGYIDE